MRPSPFHAGWLLVASCCALLTANLVYIIPVNVLHIAVLIVLAQDPADHGVIIADLSGYSVFGLIYAKNVAEHVTCCAVLAGFVLTLLHLHREDICLRLRRAPGALPSKVISGVSDDISLLFYRAGQVTALTSDTEQMRAVFRNETRNNESTANAHMIREYASLMPNKINAS